MAKKSKPHKKLKIAVQGARNSYLPFERAIADLEKTIADMRARHQSGIDLSQEIASAEDKLEKEILKVYDHLSPWQRVQVARHPLRPYTLDYVNYLMKDFIEVRGDRHFSDDRAIVTGFARFRNHKVCIVGHQKGKDTKENLVRSFGSAHPEGYRKAMRVMRLAERFSMPIISFIDTPGAYPGIGAEERGQAEAIAYNLREMSELEVPVIVVVIGEGGSGGALGIGVGDQVMVLENAYYSVISPEGCAAILWKDNARAAEAAEVLRLTSYDLLELGIIDEVVKEPLGGAHRDFESTAETLGASIERSLKRLSRISGKRLPEKRYGKFRKMGVFTEPAAR
jgi:acetyl-CoA carboxylase carboxyl transferase subunit alpha